MSDPAAADGSSRVWFITGCSSGFGKLFVPAVVARGDQVIATARDITTLEEFSTTENVHLLQVDVTAPQDILDQKASEAMAVYGRIDVVVNNAGFVLSGVWEEMNHEETVRQFNTNVFGPLNLTRAFLPHMRSRASGTIVFMSSISGWLGVAAGGPYSASKFALEGAVESLSKEIGPLGIRTHLMVLGQFRTDILAAGRRKLFRPDSSIADYDTVIDKLDQRQEKAHGEQPGDPLQAVECILDVIRREGRMGCREHIPLRIPLGSDALKIIQNECRKTLKLVEDYEDVARSTDIPHAKLVDEYR